MSTADPLSFTAGLIIKANVEKVVSSAKTAIILDQK
jgi:hypothetical protein